MFVAKLFEKKHKISGRVEERKNVVDVSCVSMIGIKVPEVVLKLKAMHKENEKELVVKSCLVVGGRCE